jgi:hypothetical protein
MSAAATTSASAPTHTHTNEFISQSLRRLTRRYGLRSRTADRLRQQPRPSAIAEALLFLIGYNDGTLRRNDAIAEDFIGYLSVRYDISPLEVVHRLECLVDS